MLQIARRVIGLARTSLSGFLFQRTHKSPSMLSTAHYSACDPTGIKEAPILDNECIMALPEETRFRKNLQNSIMVPVMVDLTPINGIPEVQLRTRRARIHQPTKNAMQSGVNNIQHWEIEFDNKMRWENPLMGWTSGPDSLSSMRLRFGDPCQAIEYCEKNGWMWYVDIPRTEREFRAKKYEYYFSWDKRTRVSTK